VLDSLFASDHHSGSDPVTDSAQASVHSLSFSLSQDQNSKSLFVFQTNNDEMRFHQSAIVTGNSSPHTVIQAILTPINKT